MKAYLEIVELENDVTTASGGERCGALDCLEDNPTNECPFGG